MHFSSRHNSQLLCRFFTSKQLFYLFLLKFPAFREHFLLMLVLMARITIRIKLFFKEIFLNEN